VKFLVHGEDEANPVGCLASDETPLLSGTGPAIKAAFPGNARFIAALFKKGQWREYGRPGKANESAVLSPR
jgi:hypothetical protein